ncbi:MAG: TIR domain-containing protein [bacterium]
MKNKTKIFLCYTRQDETQVKTLYDKLKFAGFRPWMDSVDLAGGKSLAKVIHKEIENSHIFLACLSKHSLSRSGFVRREINIALNALRQLLSDNIKLIPVRLEPLAVKDVPEKLQLFQWVDYFELDGWSRLLRAISMALDRQRVTKPVVLRRSSQALAEEDVAAMLREENFFDQQKNPAGNGLQHHYEPVEYDEKKLVIDHTSKLHWQQGGSSRQMTFSEAQKSIRKLNAEKYGGYSDWRLPTLAEAMSLMQPCVSTSGLFIDPVFDTTQKWIWTSDKCVDVSSRYVWVVYFDYGYCYGYYPSNYSAFIRAVRS